MHKFSITPVNSSARRGAYLVECGHANWVLLQDGTDLTLIDGGYPGNADDVEASIAEIGRSIGDIRGALLTHAHVDHLGGLAILAARHQIPIYLDATEVPNARREVKEQAGPLDIAKLIHRRGTMGWVSQITRLGALKNVHIEQGYAFTPGAPIDLPGYPKPIASYGHTSGHSSFVVADGEVLASGDALVTAHATSSVRGPQLLADPFHHDPKAAAMALHQFSSIDAPVIFPGHGPAHYGSAAQAVTRMLFIR